MKLQCKNKGNNKSITTGKEYEVINETEARYSIINDKGIQANYAKNLFSKAIEIIPEIPIIDGLEAETSINNENEDLGFMITIKIDGVNDYVFEKDNVLNILESPISCGIQLVSGLDELMNFVNEFKDDFRDYLDENIKNFKIDEDLDFDTFYKEIAELLIIDLIEEYKGSCLYLLLSTNIENNPNYNIEIIQYLNQISEVDLFGANPNSGNDIQLWILKCN